MLPFLSEISGAAVAHPLIYAQRSQSHMHSPSKEDAKHTMFPLLRPLYEACHTAFDTMHQESKDWWHKVSPRTKANVMRDYLLFEVKKIVEDYEGIRFVRKNGLTLLGVNEKIVIRIKKLGSNLSTSNIQTAQNSAFEKQQLLLTGFTEVVSLNLGYIINEIWTKIEAVYITCPNGYKKVSWYIRLDDEMGGVAEIITPELVPADGETSSTFRVKEEAKKERREIDGASG